MPKTLKETWLNKRHFRLAAAALCVLAAHPMPANAQLLDENTANGYWTLEKQRQDKLRAGRTPTIRQTPTHLIRRAAPIRGPDSPMESSPPVMSEPEDMTAPVAAPVQIKANAIVIGDNLGQWLGAGLKEAFAASPNISILLRTKDNSGLVRDDYFDWPKAARDMAAGSEKIDLAIILIGSNDRQMLRESGAILELRSPKWKEIYLERAKAIGRIFGDRKVPLIWVGLPIMNYERLSADMLEFNALFKKAAEETGAHFVDIWEAFADDRGQFSSYGPDVNGQMARLRASDGIHFTRAGARKLAYFVERDMRRIFENMRPAVEPAAPTLAPMPETPRKAPEAPSAQPQMKPEAGPVIVLTNPPRAAGGALLDHTSPLSAQDRETSGRLERTLVQGHAPDPRPGRADDFSWPRK
jgi:hypothetical protein